MADKICTVCGKELKRVEEVVYGICIKCSKEKEN